MTDCLAQRLGAAVTKLAIVFQMAVDRQPILLGLLLEGIGGSLHHGSSRLKHKWVSVVGFTTCGDDPGWRQALAING